jgi:hypothetical protein
MLKVQLETTTIAKEIRIKRAVEMIEVVLTRNRIVEDLLIFSTTAHLIIKAQLEVPILDLLIPHLDHHLISCQ